MRILLAEDDRRIANFIIKGLRENAYAVDAAADEVVGRSDIAEHVWDENFDVFSNLIEVYVNRLRSKMDEGFHVQLIHTRRGAGYILTDGKANPSV